MSPLAATFVQVLSAAGTTVGSGYLAAQRSICTCAHVCAYALGDPDRKLSPAAPTELIKVAFPFLSEEKFSARVAGWSPDLPEGTDAALLELPEDPPTGAAVLATVPSKNAVGAPFEVHGYQTGTSFDVHAKGIVGEQNGRGWFELVGTSARGFFVQPGFSGSAVFDVSQQAIIGMIKAVATDSSVRVAFLIPNELLCKSLAGYGISPADSSLLAFDKQRGLQFVEAARRDVGARDAIAERLFVLVARTADPTQRYWIYLALKQIGGERSKLALDRSAAIESDEFAQRGLQDFLRG
jgi:hypothetical protein